MLILELPKRGVLDCATEAGRLVRKSRGMRGAFYFSIAKGGEHSPDRQRV